MGERLVLGIQKTLEAATDHLEKELMVKYTNSIEKELQRFKSEAPDQISAVDQERLVSLEKRFAETEIRVSEQVQGLMQELAKHLEDEHEARVNCIAEIRAEIAQYAEMPAIAQTMRDLVLCQACPVCQACQVSTNDAQIRNQILN